MFLGDKRIFSMGIKGSGEIDSLSGEMKTYFLSLFFFSKNKSFSKIGYGTFRFVNDFPRFMAKFLKTVH